jgi:hypothetical protein
LYIYIMSNSAYADQRVYGGNIADISNSPFTDERRQGGGGGSPSDGTGNVQYNIANQTLNTRLAEVNTIIPDINQGASGFVIGNDVGSLNFDATDGNIKITHGQNETGNISLECEATTGGNGNIILATDTVGTTGAGNLNANISGNILLNAQQAVSITSSLADVTLQADEIVRTRGVKGAKMEAGFDLNTGLYENKIDMTIDPAEAKIEIKSEGTDAENTIQLTTTSSAPSQAGSVNLSLFSTASPLVSDRLVMAIDGIVDNPPTNSPAWFSVFGRTVSQQFRSFDLFSNQVRFRNFLTMSFAGGTVNPIYEFKPDQFYRFNNDPTATGNALTVTAGSGTEGDPWGMEWLPSSGGTSDVTYANATFVANGQSLVANSIPINTIFVGESGSASAFPNNLYRHSISSTSSTMTIKSESLDTTPDEVVLNIEADRNTDGTPDRTRIQLRSRQTTPGLGSDQMELSIGQSQGIDPATAGSPISINSAGIPWFRVVGRGIGGGAGVFYEDSLTSSLLLGGIKRYARFKDFLYAWGINASTTDVTLGLKDNPKYGLHYRLGGGTDQYDTIRYRYNNVPNEGDVLTVGTGDGSDATPFELEWTPPSGGGGGALDSLDINYDTSSSTLVLSDPVDGIISSTPIVSGRTVLIESLVVNGQSRFSCLGLSNSVFPPPPSTKLVGNNPPSVPLASDGSSLWSVGNTFRITVAGKINDFDNNDNLEYTVYSNRGQLSQNILNNFNLELSGVLNTSFGFTWVVLFTVRTVNDGLTLGTIATNSNFTYTDDQFKPETEGAIVSNVNASFDTSIEQYLDLTLRFPSAGNSLSVTNMVIERIF